MIRKKSSRISARSCPSRSGRFFRTNSSCSDAGRATRGRRAMKSARSSSGARRDAKRSGAASRGGAAVRPLTSRRRRFPSALEISRFRGESVGGRELGQPLEVRSGIVARRQAELLQIRGTEPERAGVLLGGVVTAVHHALPGNAVGDAEDVRKLVDRRRKSARRNRR